MLSKWSPTITFLVFSASITESNTGTLDMSDFPALAERGRQTNEISNALGSFQSSAMSGRPQYGKCEIF